MGRIETLREKIRRWFAAGVLIYVKRRAARSSHAL
jgi:hypothetical protein